MHPFLQRGADAARSGRPRDAAEWFARALEADDSNPMARAWLGQALCASRRQRDGTRELRHAAEQLLAQGEQNRLSRVVEIIVQLQHWADIPSALALSERLADAFPREAKVQQLLAMCLHQMNRPAEALAACRIAAALQPGDAMLEVLQASIELESRLGDAAHSRLQAILARPVPALVRFRAHKERARALDMVASYDEAFRSLEEAERASLDVPEFQRVDLTLVPRRIAANSRSFTAEAMGRWSRTPFDDRGAPIFVVGFYRSGTTLAQEVLDAHPRCFVADEANLVHEALRELAALRPSTDDIAAQLATLDEGEVQRLRQAYWETAYGRYGTAIDDKVFFDKFTLNTVDLGFITTVFPDAKILFLLRDPRDVCLSCFMQMMPATAATAHLLQWKRVAAFYADVMAWWLLIRARLTVPWMEVRYEDAVADFEGTFRRVLSFCGLEWDAALPLFHERAATKFVGSPSRHQVAQPLYATSTQRWRRYEPHFAPVLDRLEPFIETFGYASPA